MVDEDQHLLEAEDEMEEEDKMEEEEEEERQGEEGKGKGKVKERKEKVEEGEIEEGEIEEEKEREAKRKRSESFTHNTQQPTKKSRHRAQWHKIRTAKHHEYRNTHGYTATTKTRQKLVSNSSPLYTTLKTEDLPVANSVYQGLGKTHGFHAWVVVGMGMGQRLLTHAQPTTHEGGLAGLMGKCPN